MQHRTHIMDIDGASSSYWLRPELWEESGMLEVYMDLLREELQAQGIESKHHTLRTAALLGCRLPTFARFREVSERLEHVLDGHTTNDGSPLPRSVIRTMAKCLVTPENMDSSTSDPQANTLPAAA